MPTKITIPIQTPGSPSGTPPHSTRTIPVEHIKEGTTLTDAFKTQNFTLPWPQEDMKELDNYLDFIAGKPAKIRSTQGLSDAVFTSFVMCDIEYTIATLTTFVETPELCPEMLDNLKQIVLYEPRKRKNSLLSKVMSKMLKLLELNPEAITDLNLKELDSLVEQIDSLNLWEDFHAECLFYWLVKNKDVNGFLRVAKKFDFMRTADTPIIRMHRLTGLMDWCAYRLKEDEKKNKEDKDLNLIQYKLYVSYYDHINANYGTTRERNWSLNTRLSTGPKEGDRFHKTVSYNMPFKFFFELGNLGDEEDVEIMTDNNTPIKIGTLATVTIFQLPFFGNFKSVKHTLKISYVKKDVIVGFNIPQGKEEKEEEIVDEVEEEEEFIMDEPMEEDIMNDDSDVVFIGEKRKGRRLEPLTKRIKLEPTKVKVEPTRAKSTVIETPKIEKKSITITSSSEGKKEESHFLSSFTHNFSIRLEKIEWKDIKNVSIDSEIEF